MARNANGTAFTSPQVVFPGTDGVALQWFIDDTAVGESYEDKWGDFVTWTAIGGTTVRYLGIPNDPDFLTDVLMPTAGTYGAWSTSASSQKPQDGATTPPSASGIGFAWTIVLPPHG